MCLCWLPQSWEFPAALRSPAAPALHITLPLAISFFTFQQIMFLADTARAGGVGLPPFISYAAFVTFFPDLIAGPIVRPGNIIPQLTEPEMIRPRSDSLADGTLIFLLGLAEKLVLADMFGRFRGYRVGCRPRRRFDLLRGLVRHPSPTPYRFISTSRATPTWPSASPGCSTYASRLNFDSPYQATSIADFWRRWPITLGGFLRDYLYIPLGGNRCAPLQQTGNLMATMLLAGLWHVAGGILSSGVGCTGSSLSSTSNIAVCLLRIKCGAPHLMRNVAPIVMWR